MSCRGFTRRIALWVGGDLGSAEAAAVERHLEGCEACRSRAEGLRRAMAGLRALDTRACEGLGSVRVPRTLPATGVRRRRALPLAVAAAAVVVALAAVAVVALLDRRTSPGRPTSVRVARLTAPPVRPAQPDVRRPDSGAAPVVPPPPPSPEVVAPEAIAAGDPGVDLSPEAAPSAAEAAPYTIKILTEDPDIVIYWVVDPKGVRNAPQNT